ncbi:transmembrane protein 132B [Stigmatopora nigra]
METIQARSTPRAGGRQLHLGTLILLLWEVCGSHSGSSGPGQSTADSSPARFSTSLPTYLPVRCRLNGADSAFFLREANQDVMRNGSLSSRTEPFFLSRLEAGVAAPHALPSVACGYGNVSAEQQIPVELLQGPPPSLQPNPSHITLNWKVKGHIVASKVGSTQPWIQVLFYLAGRRWDESDPTPPSLLPCVRSLAVRDPGESAPSAGCRLEGPMGVCVVRLEIPLAWFAPLQARRRPTEGTLPSLDVYFSVIPVEGARAECPSYVNELWKSPNANAGSLGGLGMNPWIPLVDGGLQDMQKIGSVDMSVGPVTPQGELLTMDRNVDILVPPSPVRLGKTVAFAVYMKTESLAEQFILRVWFQSGISFLAVKPSDLVAWEIKQEMAPGGGSLAVMCQRKSSSTARLESPSYEVMQLDFEVDNVITLASTQTLHWSVEYASGTPSSAERVSHLYISNDDIQGIVPLAQDTEVLNTAILTGRRVVLPVKLVTVGTDGTVRQVDDSLSCSSADVDVLKVSPNCDEVVVNGKEIRGRHGVSVAFAYMHLTAKLPLNVWVPKLPLQIHVSDTELSQVKGWRVPIAPNAAANSNSRRPTRDSDDDEDDERKGKGCTLQYQYALVRVLTHFVAEPADPGGEVVHMLGADWQADITHLVLDQLKVEDERIAKLVDGRVLIGRDLGITTIQVLSPLSDSILAEKTVTVLDDKVTINDMGVQLVASLSLNMAAAAAGGNSQAVQLTATASDLMRAPKQEAAISAWIHYSDGSVTPLDIYDPKDFLLSAVSLDENVISVTNQEQQWPVVVAEGEGRGPLVRVEMVISETCQKSKRKSVLASGLGNVAVKFGISHGDPKGTDGLLEGENGEENGTERPKVGEGTEWNSKSVAVAVEREEGAMRKVSLTTKSTVTHRMSGGKAGSGGRVGGGGPSQAGDYASYPAQVEVPGPADGELTQTTRGLSDLEIGMYALLGVFCLAILVFLINCVSFAFRYRHKQVPVLETGGNMNHAHDWVWLGNEADLLADHPDHTDSCPGGPLPDECTTIIDRGEDAYEESKYLLNGAGAVLAVATNRASGGPHRGVSRSQTLPRSLQDPHQCLSAIATARHDPEHLNNSPRASAKRKRVKFNSFATVLPNERHQGVAVGGPYANPSVLLGKGGEDDIKWVCHDVDAGQSEIRSYMERLQDNL